ncbi:MAG TPA: hypothetical protein VIL13_08040 [Longimicrobiales bacterium]
MHLLSWALVALAAAAALVVVSYLYRRREAPGRGRALLAALRWAALSLLILMLFDPSFPVPEVQASGDTRTRVLVDGSLSMALPVGPGEAASRWERAREEARRVGGSVLLFGDAPRLVAPDSLVALQPGAGSSRLLPALAAASEAGVRRVVVLSDGGIEDAAEVARALPELGLDVEIRPVVAAEVTNRALAEVEAPEWAEAGKPLEIRVGVTAVGPAAGDSVAVLLRQGEKVLTRARVATPPPGRVATATLRVTPEVPGAGAGKRSALVRYDIALEGGDAAADDDERSVYVLVSDEPVGVALVSLRPDWEPRFLQPVLEQSLGLPVKGYLRTRQGTYVRLGTGLDAGRRAGEDEVRAAVAAADLVVLHGLEAGSPAWAQEAARNARRVLIFPADGASSLDLPVPILPLAPGDWYASGDVPASPVAPLLTGVKVEQMPPLQGLRPVPRTAGAWAPLHAMRGRRGLPSPIALAGETNGRRWAVALGVGYWQWAFRGGEAREAYRRLWGAIGGWLVQEDRELVAAAVRPARRVAPRGEPLHWLARGLNADSVALRISDAKGAVALDTVVAVTQGDTATTPALPPGHYRYQARAFAGGREVAQAEGPFTVESYSPDFTRPTVALAGREGGRAAGTLGAAGPHSGRPLRASPLPYLLLVLLLSTEWVLRRRWGLR